MKHNLPLLLMAFRFLSFFTGKSAPKQSGFDDHPLPKLIFDRHSLRYLAANKAAVALYGYTKEEFLVMTLREIRPVWELQKLERHLSAQTLYGTNTGIWRHLKKNGDIMLVKVSAEDVLFEGQQQRQVTIEELPPEHLDELTERY